MSQVITKRVQSIAKSVPEGRDAFRNGHPGRAAAAREHVQLAGDRVRRRIERRRRKLPRKPIESRFVFWFNGNGIPERYWIPSRTGRDFDLPPCLSPLAPFRNDIHVLTGLDNSAASVPGPGNGHHKSISGVTTATPFTGHGAGGPSIDQVIASKIGTESRFRSLQIGVSQESFGESIQRNMSWAGYNRPLPPEMLPHKLVRPPVRRARRRLGQPQTQHPRCRPRGRDATSKRLCRRMTRPGVDEHLSAIRDIERAITGLPDDYRRVEAPEYDGDMKDWPRIAKLQSDLLAQALVTRQTRVASYMLTKGQGLSRFPWLGLTAARHHDYTHADGLAPGADGADGQRVLRDICRWHVEEFAYLARKAAIDSRRRWHGARPHVPALCP